MKKIYGHVDAQLRTQSRVRLSAVAILATWACVPATIAPLMAEERLFEPVESAISWTQDIGSRKQLFLDDLLIAEVSGISKLVGRPQKQVSNPIIVADKPWEREKSTPFPGVRLHGQSVFFDADDGVFKMWYYGGYWRSMPKDRDEVAPWCYATSKDGIHWEKPSLGIVAFEGSKQNNIVDATPAMTFMCVVKTPHDLDPSRLYKAWGEIEPKNDVSKHGFGVAFSPDGLHWKMYEGNPVIRKGPDISDASVILGWDPRIQKYVGYPRPGRPIAHQWPGSDNIRSIGYSESVDFIHWTPTKPMLTPSGRDRVDRQYHAFNVAFDSESRIYVGFLSIHHTHDQTWDTYLLSSRDGFHWTWIDRDCPFIRRGDAESYDAGYIHPAAPITCGDQIWIYYGAWPHAHSYDVNPNEMGRLVAPGIKTSSIGVATMPRDRYVGLLAGPRPGVICTRALRFQGNKLRLDLDASLADSISKPRRLTDGECQVRVEIMDESGKPFPGFALAKCNTILESGKCDVTWDGHPDLGKLQQQRIRLKIELRHAAIYSFQFLTD